MAIQVLPTGFEGLARGIESLAAGVGQSLFSQEQERKRFEENLRMNPHMIPEVGRTAWLASQTEGGLEAFASQVGFDPEYVQTFVDAYNPSLQEQVEVHRARNPDALAANIGLAELADEATKAQMEEIRDVSTLSGGLARARMEGGIIKYTINDEVAEFKFRGLMREHEGEAAKFNTKILRDYENMLNNMPDGHMKQMAIAALANPEFVRHVQFHEGLAHEEMMLRMRMAATEGLDDHELFARQWELTTSFMNESEKAVVAYENALNMKRGTGRDAAINAALRRLKSTHEQMSAAVRDGLVLPTNSIAVELEARGLWGRPELATLVTPFESREQQIARAYAAGEIDEEFLKGSIEFQTGRNAHGVPFSIDDFQTYTRMYQQEAGDLPPDEGALPPSAQAPRGGPVGLPTSAQLEDMSFEELDQFVKEIYPSLMQSGALAGRNRLEASRLRQEALRLRSRRRPTEEVPARLRSPTLMGPGGGGR